MKQKLIEKMIAFSEGNTHDIAHFMKVYAYAETIGHMEGLDERSQKILEYSAIVHDIACPLCRVKYGNTDGKHQEAESAALLHDFLAEFEMDEEMKERIIFIVSHHHTYTGVDGMDWQILLEADEMVNADESDHSAEQIREFEKNVFRTESGIHLLNMIYTKKLN